MRFQRLFSIKPSYFPYGLRVQTVPFTIENQSLIKKFVLAEHFIDSKKIKPAWRNTQHQLFFASTEFRPIAFAGIETGDGKIIQRYIGENDQQIFHGETLFVHAMEVLPTYRGLGIQILMWKKICEHALFNNIESIIWDPIDKEAYLRFFNKFNIAPDQHDFTQIIALGAYSDGDSTYDRYYEDYVTILQIDRKSLKDLVERLEAALQTPMVDLKTANTMNNK